MKIDVFSKKYSLILNPYSLESFEQLTIFLSEKDKTITFKKLKNNSIDVFSFLLENKIIYVLESDWMRKKGYKNTKLNNEEIIKTLKEKWNIDTSFEVLYNLFWFKYQDWYTESFVQKGLTIYTTNWNLFLNEKIGDLDKWIEENKPK